jgi:hypothetical protein
MFKGFKKLTKTELHHMTKEAGCITTKELEETFAFHAKCRAEGAKTEPCFECKAIARKLGHAT